jgi:hypothetical protein
VAKVLGLLVIECQCHVAWVEMKSEDAREVTDDLAEGSVNLKFTGGFTG